MPDGRQQQPATTRPASSSSDLGASAEVAQAILGSSPDCIKLLSLDGRLLFMSVGGLCAMEVDDFDRQLKGADWLSFWAERDRPQV